MSVPPERRWLARGLDALAALVVLAAIVRFAVLPHLRPIAVAAPPVTLATLGGGRFDLERARGQLVFLDFWASWCDPCRASIPLVQHFRRTHPGVTVLSVDVGEPTRLVAPFAARFGMADVALDPDETAAHAFGVDGYPTLVAIDPSGTIRARWIGFNPDIERAMGDVAARYAAPARSAAVERRGALVQEGS
jgi:thiol-disulfide isomerase/thioredoxin